MLVEAGGSVALLAETDELIGAEQYVLQSVRDFKTAERFVASLAASPSTRPTTTRVPKATRRAATCFAASITSPSSRSAPR